MEVSTVFKKGIELTIKEYCPKGFVRKQMRIKPQMLPITITFEQLSQLELIKICGESSEHPAWHEFHRRFDSYIKMYVKKAWKKRMIGNEIDRACAQEINSDMVQDVYVKLLEDDQQALRKFKGINENSFLAYLARIAANIVAEYFRKQLAEKRKGQTLSVELLLDERFSHLKGSRVLTYTYLSHNYEPEVLARITLGELFDLLEVTLRGDNLKRDKFIFQLYIIDGLSTEQIAELPGLRLKVSSVESIIRRVRDKLYQALQSKISLCQRVA